MERVLSVLSAVLLVGLVLGFFLYYWNTAATARANAMLNQFAVASEAFQKEYGNRPKAVDELLGKNPRGIVFTTLSTHHIPTDYRVVPPPPGSDAFIIEWLGPDGTFGTADDLQMIHDDSGVRVGPP